MSDFLDCCGAEPLRAERDALESALANAIRQRDDARLEAEGLRSLAAEYHLKIPTGPGGLEAAFRSTLGFALKAAEESGEALSRASRENRESRAEVGRLTVENRELKGDVERKTRHRDEARLEADRLKGEVARLAKERDDATAWGEKWRAERDTWKAKTEDRDRVMAVRARDYHAMAKERNEALAEIRSLNTPRANLDDCRFEALKARLEQTIVTLRRAAEAIGSLG